MSLSEAKRSYAREYYHRKLKNNPKDRAYRAAYYATHPHRDRYKRLRDAIFAFYENKCSKCGFEDKRALQLDHIHNDGHVDRLKERGTPLTIQRKILKDSLVAARFQLLCANCNWIKRAEYEEFLKDVA